MSKTAKKHSKGFKRDKEFSGNKLERDVGGIVSLQAQMSPYFQLREKLKCIEHMDKSETQLKTSP